MDTLDLKYNYILSKMVGKLTEAETSSATNMELAIVNTWNREKLIAGQPLAKPAKMIVAFLRKSGVNGTGVHLGRGFAKPIILTPEWTKWGASNVTPKTDLMIGKYKFSLKMGRGQLMSGGKSETTATFMNAIAKIKKSKKDKIMISNIEKAIDKFVEGGYTDKGTVSANLTTDKVIIAGDKAHKTMMVLLGEFFQENEEFKISFAHEALSGLAKFGKKSPGHATFILTASKDGKKNYIKKTSDKSYVKKVANAMSLSVRFKSVSQKKVIDGKKVKTGRYNFWSVVGLVTGQLHEELKAYEGQVLTEGIMSRIWDRMKSFMTKLFIKVKAFIRQGVDKVIEFLNAEPDIRFKNEINFTSLG